MYNDADRITELEKQLEIIRSQLSRIPTRIATPQLRASIIRAQVKGAASSATFPVDNVVLQTGIDPRDAPEDMAEEVTIDNPAGLEFEDDQIIYCVYNEDEAIWEPLTILGEEGPPGPAIDIVRFTLTADLPLLTTSATATVLSSTDGTTGTITVTDPDANFSAFIGHRGYAYHDGTAYRILFIEGPARFADCIATADSAFDDDTITADINNWWGAPPNGDEPDPLTGITVYKLLLPTEMVSVFAGDNFRAIWVESTNQWELFWYSGMRITVKGEITGTAVNSGTSNFTLTNLELVNGWYLPDTDITVTNEPPIHADVGDIVYARFNLTVGDNPLNNWDTGDGGNFLEKLKGIGSYDEGGSIQFVVAEMVDDPEWITPNNDDADTKQYLTKNASNQLEWADGTGGQYILITETIPAADWGDATNTVTPEDFIGYSVDGMLSEIECTSSWPEDITVSGEGKAKFGYVDGSNQLVNVMCTEVDWTPPEP